MLKAMAHPLGRFWVYPGAVVQPFGGTGGKEQTLISLALVSLLLITHSTAFTGISKQTLICLAVLLQPPCSLDQFVQLGF